RLPRTFEGALQHSALWPLRPTRIQILQINVGRRCNQTCRHCHVDAGPDRTEVMPREVIEAVFRFLERAHVPTLDITGGAAELHPDFREMITRATALGAHVIHRCNLTAVLLPNYADIPALLAAHGVEIVASLPYFQGRETDAQRGEGVFEESIESLRRLNALGYGRGTGLLLHLITNPVGMFLPAAQHELELRWKQEMRTRYGIEFDRLYTITNMPIGRFLEFLEGRGKTEEYVSRLASAYNAGAAAAVMCRNTLSVGWDGTLYDCDFNQMLGLDLDAAVPRTIFDADVGALQNRAIAVGPHCFGCTANGGSSCGGAIT
ncbi:MAG: arsenosugar biosynthesis radical SAM (seleno)protein ArsS, partial [Gemmatimonadaceae bacterium]